MITVFATLEVFSEENGLSMTLSWKNEKPPHFQKITHFFFWIEVI